MIPLSKLLGNYPNTLEAKLKANAPVDTGNLKRSIRAFVTTNSLSVEMVDYAKFVENKTHFISDVINEQELTTMVGIMGENVAKAIVDELEKILKSKNK